MLIRTQCICLESELLRGEQPKNNYLADPALDAWLKVELHSCILGALFLAVPRRYRVSGLLKYKIFDV